MNQAQRSARSAQHPDFASAPAPHPRLRDAYDHAAGSPLLRSCRRPPLRASQPADVPVHGVRRPMSAKCGCRVRSGLGHRGVFLSPSAEAADVVRWELAGA